MPTDAVTWRRIAAVAALLIFGILPPNDSVADEPYPIWWSPRLELESLEQIDARMARRFWSASRDDGGLELYPEGDNSGAKREARNCDELLELRDRSYFARSTNDTNLMWHFDSWCRAVAAFKNAKRATRSFVHDFTLDRDSVNYLPAFVVPAYSCYAVCLQKEANDRRIPLANFHAPFEIIEADGLRIVVENSTSRESVEIVGRADFTQDGLEDLMVISRSTNLDTGPTAALHLTQVYVLTRDRAEGVLYVVDAVRHLCPNYGCAPP